MDRRQQQRRQASYKTYIDGNTVRRVQVQALPEEQPVRQRQQQSGRRVQKATGRNRQRAMQMDIGYVLFLTAAAVVTLFIAINYLKLQAESTSLRSQLTALESEYSTLKLHNDEEYHRALSSVDLEYVRDTAINKLGMVYASSGQVVTYNDQDGDYVRQYEDVQAE